MSEPKIDPFWNNDSSMSLRPFFVIGIPVLVIVLSVLLSGLKSHTQLGQQGKKDVYNPAECVDSGFVGGVNRLLAELLLDTLEEVTPVTDLESLNKKYQALTFALPYGEEHKAVIEASDLRLVGIKAERIKANSLRMFYYNSRLPQLLQSQKEQLSETYFHIYSKGLAYDKSVGKKPIKLTRVEIIPSMFKVALTKDPWTGVVQGAQNCLFDNDKTVYLNYGKSILPLPKLRRADLTNSVKLQSVAEESVLLTVKGAALDYYDIYKTFFVGDEKKSCANILMKASAEEKQGTAPYFTICCAHDSVYLRSALKMRVFGSQKSKVESQKSKVKGQKTLDLRPSTLDSEARPSTLDGEAGPSTFDSNSEGLVTAKVRGNQHDAVFPLEDGMKIVAYSADDYKIAEFTLFTQDPTRTLSSLSMTNIGKERTVIPTEYTDLFTRQVIRGLARNMTNTYNIDTVQLSLDPLLSKAFETELRDYLSVIRRQIGTPRHIRRETEQYDISLTVMDVATGDVIASPFYSTRLDEIPEALHISSRNPALTRRFVGSTFKPMVALASVLTNPLLMELDTHGKYHMNEGGETATFFGRRTLSWAKKSASHWSGTRFTDFLSYSDDVYPVALAALAMSGARIWCQKSKVESQKSKVVHPEGTLDLRPSTLDGEAFLLPVSGDNNYFKMNPRENLLYFRSGDEVNFGPQNHPFNDWLTYLYAANYESDVNTDTIFRNLYSQNNLNHQERCFGLDEIIPDPTNLYLNRFLEGSNFRHMLPPWVLGQGDNQWSPVKLAEAWCRMLSKRNVMATLIHNPAQPVSLVDGVEREPQKMTVFGPATKSQTNATWNKFLASLNEAQSFASSHNNTLQKMHSQVQALNESGIDKHLLLFSKTGTPDVYDRYDIPLIGGNRRQIDIGMYCFGLVDAGQFENVKQDKPSHGIVAVIRITRTYECPQCSKGHGQCSRCAAFNGVSSTHARNFFAANAGRLRKFYDMTRVYY